MGMINATIGLLYRELQEPYGRRMDATNIPNTHLSIPSNLRVL